MRSSKVAGAGAAVLVRIEHLACLVGRGGPPCIASLRWSAPPSGGSDVRPLPRPAASQEEEGAPAHAVALLDELPANKAMLRYCILFLFYHIADFT